MIKKGEKRERLRVEPLKETQPSRGTHPPRIIDRVGKAKFGYDFGSYLGIRIRVKVGALKTQKKYRTMADFAYLDACQREGQT